MQNYIGSYAISNVLVKKYVMYEKTFSYYWKCPSPFFYFVWARFMKTLVFVRAISYASLDTASTEFNYKINSRTV